MNATINICFSFIRISIAQGGRFARSISFLFVVTNKHITTKTCQKYSQNDWVLQFHYLCYHHTLSKHKLCCSCKAICNWRILNDNLIDLDCSEFYSANKFVNHLTLICKYFLCFPFSKSFWTIFFFFARSLRQWIAVYCVLLNFILSYLKCISRFSFFPFFFLLSWDFCILLLFFLIKNKNAWSKKRVFLKRFYDLNVKWK